MPVLGIPTGVKMHSGVFATTPESAGDVAAEYLATGASAALRDGEVVDVDEDAVRAGRISTRLYGAMRVPDDARRVQAMKASPPPSSDEADLDAVCAELAVAMDPRRLYVIGPGTTTRRVMRTLGLPATLLGVDVVQAGRLVARRRGEAELLDLLAAEPATLVVGVVGGQGALLGRGNQQLSPAVLRRIGLDDVEIVAGLRKLLALDPPVLHVDTGDPELDASLVGYRRVHVAPRSNPRLQGGRMTAHPYMPNSTPALRRELLDAVGVDDVEELFAQIPPEHRLKQPLDAAARAPSPRRRCDATSSTCWPGTRRASGTSASSAAASGSTTCPRSSTRSPAAASSSRPCGARPRPTTAATRRGSNSPASSPS